MRGCVASCSGLSSLFWRGVVKLGAVRQGTRIVPRIETATGDETGLLWLSRNVLGKK